MNWTEDLLARLVAARGFSGDEAAAADVATAAARELCYDVQRAGNNVWLRIGRGRPALLLNSHLDTVPPCAGWTVDPFAAQWRDGRLIGLGANDAKGCVAAILGAVRELVHAAVQLPGTLVVACTAEEESGGKGGIASLLDRLGPLDAGLVGEPTSLQPVIAQRGMLILNCTAHGVSAHVAHAEAAGAVNAISMAARDIAKLDALRFEPHPLLGETRARVTIIKGGLRNNQIPDRCEFVVDLRTTPNLDQAAVARQVSELLESELTIHSDRYAPKATHAGQPIVRAAVGAAGTDPIGSATASDWAWLGDLPVVKIGPGDTLRSHRPDEFLTAEELQRGVAFYRNAVLAYFAETGAEARRDG